MAWKQVTAHSERVLGDSDSSLKTLLFSKKCRALQRARLWFGLWVACIAPSSLCVHPHTKTQTHTYFSGLGAGGLFVLRYSSEQHFNDTDEWILQSGIIWGENFHFPRLLILAK